MLREPTCASLVAPQGADSVGGRKSQLSDKPQVEIVRMVRKDDKTAADVSGS